MSSLVTDLNSSTAQEIVNRVCWLYLARLHFCESPVGLCDADSIIDITISFARCRHEAVQKIETMLVKAFNLHYDLQT